MAEALVPQSGQRNSGQGCSFFQLAGQPCVSTTEGHFICVSIKGHIFQDDAKQEKRNKKKVIQLFLKTLNALLNEGKGVLCLHSTNYEFIGGFVEQVDDKVNSMLNDGSLFSDKIITTPVKNTVENNIEHARRRYTVVTSALSQLPFIVSYNTSVSLDKGLDTPSHSQFKAFFKHVSTTHATSGRCKETVFNFTDEEEVVNGGPFKESRSLQAKSVPSCKMLSLTLLENYVWEKVKLYISAFSKNSEGGSVLFGLAEQNKIVTNTDEWTHVSGTELNSPIRNVHRSWGAMKHVTREEYLLIACDKYHILGLSVVDQVSDQWIEVRSEEEFREIFVFAEQNSGQWKVYKEKTNNTYRVERRTGKIICEGVTIPRGWQSKLKKTICEKARDELLWVGHEIPANPVAVKYHSVQDKNEKKVIEVAVKHFHGIVFTDTEGPELYKVDATSLQRRTDLDAIVSRMELTEWLCAQLGEEANDTTFKARKPTFSEL